MLDQDKKVAIVLDAEIILRHALEFFKKAVEDVDGDPTDRIREILAKVF